MIYFYLYPALIFFMLFILYKYDKKNTLIILLISATFILYPLGSNSFEKKITLTYPIILPLIILLFYNLSKKTEILSIKKTLIYFKIISIILFLQILININNFPYRDSKLSNMNISFSTPSLKNIYSTSARVYAIQPVIDKILTLKSDSSTLLSLGATNLFNFATNINGVFDYPNPSYIDIRFVQTKLNEFEIKHSLPEFIIYPLIDVTYNDWEISKQPIKIEKPFFNMIDIFIKKNNYELIYLSPYFKIYRVNKF